MGPAGGDAVGVNALGSEFGGERLGERNEGAFAGGVIGVAGFAALAGGGRDEHDVTAAAVFRPWAREHVGRGGVNEAEGGVDVGGNGTAPLGGGHGGDVGFDGRPDAVVDDEDVEVAEGVEDMGDEGFAVFGSREIPLDGEAGSGTSTSGGEGLSLFGGLAIAEGDAGSGLVEEANGGGADAARASGDEGGAPSEGEGDAGCG